MSICISLLVLGGVYNGSAAKLYCMDVKDASIVSNLLENSTDEEIQYVLNS